MPPGKQGDPNEFGNTIGSRSQVAKRCLADSCESFCHRQAELLLRRNLHSMCNFIRHFMRTKIVERGRRASAVVRGPRCSRNSRCCNSCTRRDSVSDLRLYSTAGGTPILGGSQRLAPPSVQPLPHNSPAPPRPSTFAPSRA